MRDTALEFFNAREAEVYAAFRAQTARHLADAAAGHVNPFWNDRGDVDAMSHHDPSVRHLDIREAFERIRQSDTLNVRRGAGVHTAPRPAVSGCEIVMEDRLISPEDSTGLRYAFDVDLIALLDLAPPAPQVPDIFDAYQRRAGPVALPDFLAALATLVARGWLVWSRP